MKSIRFIQCRQLLVKLFVLAFTIHYSLFTIHCFSQGVGLNNTNAAPNSSAMLDVNSMTQGILISRMSDAQRNVIPSPAIGLLIFNTTTNNFNYYKTTGWYELSRTSQSLTTGTTITGGGVAISETKAAANGSAILDVSSTMRGVLIPRTTSASLSPVAGLIYYDTFLNRLIYYDGGSWKTVCESFIGTTTGTGTLTSSGYAINVTNAGADPSAMLDVQSGTQGLLIPRMASTNIQQILPVTGLIVYSTSTNSIDYFDGSSWDKLETDAPATPGAISNTGTVICQGQGGVIYSISAVGGASLYTWSVPSDANITSGQGTTSITVTFGSASGNISVVANNVCGTSNASNLAITVNTPTASISGTTTICNGSSTTLTVGGTGTSWSWNTGTTTQAITVSPTSNTTYTVTVTANTCTATTSTTLTVNALPTVSITGITTICSGNSTTLTASGTGTSWSWNTGSTTQAITVSPASNTTYTVTITDNNCTATTSVTVTVSLPTASISGTTTICNGSSTTLTAGGTGTAWSWNTGSTTQAITISPTSNTTYTVTVTSGAGCIATTAATVTVNSLPTASIIGTTTICNGSSTTLTASGTGTSWSWNTGLTTQAITVSPTSNTTYTVTITANTCTATTSVTVTVNSLPTASISGATTICNGSSTMLTASGTGTSWSWNTGPTTQAITVSPTSNTTYTVTITTNNCTATTSATVTVSLPTASISGTTTICNGSSTTLTAGGTGTSWSWNTGSTTQAITVSPTSNTTYTVTVTSGAGCTATTSATVTVNALPTVSITGTTTICNGNSTTLTASGTGNSWTWNTGPITQAITVSPTSSTTYTVTVTSSGCTATTSATVTVNSIPAQSSAITGTTPICTGGSGDIGVGYSVTNVSGVTYTWTYSGSGFTIESNGNYGYYIVVDFSPSATAGTLSVTGSNACGIGPEQTFTITLLATPPGTATCGSQTWATVNVNTGTQQTSGTTQSLGQKWCYGDVAANCNTYGGLYQWATAMNGATSVDCNPCGSGGVQGICPSGYHIPTDLEWSQYEWCVETTIAPTGSTPLATFQGAMGNAGSTTTGVGPGDKLRATVCEGWPYSTSTNSSGFTALPGGWASSPSAGQGITYEVFFWTATDDGQGDGYAFARGLGYSAYGPRYTAGITMSHTGTTFAAYRTDYLAIYHALQD